MNKPTFNPKPLAINSLTNKQLLIEAGFNSIYEAKRTFGMTASEVYDHLNDIINNEVKQKNIKTERDNDKSRKKYIKDLALWNTQQLELKDKLKKQKKVDKKITKKEVIKSLVYKLPENSLSKLKSTLRNYIGKSIITEYIDGKKVLLNILIDDISSKFSSWWKKNSWKFMHDSVTSIFVANNRDGSFYIYEPNPLITTTKIKQAFKEGITNCLFMPIKKWAVELLEEAKSSSAKKTYNSIINKISKYEIQFVDGVPEDKIAEICNDLQVDINIDLPFAEEHFIECKSIKKRLKKFDFMNTRVNHVDVNEITNLNEFEEISYEELYKIKNKLDLDNTFYTYKKNMDSISSINTLTKQYRLNNEYNEIINKFENDNNLNECSIDDITQPELSRFINDGTHYNATIDFSFDREECYHIDMKQAYAKSQECNYYEGFLGKITDFRETDTIQGIGLYRITDLVFEDNCFKDYNDKMKMYVNDNVYTSPELKMLTDNGVLYKIVAGCWGVEKLDFEFNEDMLTKKDNGVSYYAKWCGQIDSHYLSKKFWIKGDQTYYNILKDNYGIDLIKYFSNGEICVCMPKKHNFHKGHITAFITAYQRMNVIDQLMMISYENVIRVCVDGIYHREKDVKCVNVFRPKQERHFGNEAGDTYISNLNDNDKPYIFAKPRNSFNKELHIGAGGNGKTHKNLIDNGLVKVLYLSPSWKLARNKQDEYGVKVNVWANAICEDPAKLVFIKSYNVLVIDEVSMMSEESKNYLFETYSNMKLIFCGDIGYQAPCITGDEMNHSGFDNIVKNNDNYRCKDSNLKSILDNLRLMIEHDKSASYINSYIVDEFRKMGKIINVDTLKSMYKVEDMILTGTNILKDYFTGLFTGKLPVEKYYITKNNRIYSNGEIIIGEKPLDCTCEIRHSFTTHSIQGETAHHKLYIDSSKMFNSRLFYTALSRAKTLDQIFIIESNLEMDKLNMKKELTA